MQFFFYCRDKAGTGDLRRKLLKDHWAFMRRYADAMIARGPTMSADGKTLFAVNTPDNRLEAFQVTPAGLIAKGSVLVGIEPVAVAVVLASRQQTSLERSVVVVA